MTPEETYRFDVLGYLVVEDAIEPSYLQQVQQSMNDWHAKAQQQDDATSGGTDNAGNRSSSPRKNRTGTIFFNVLDEDPRLLDLVANPRIMPFVQAMVDRPILEQFNVGFRERGGESGVHAGHTPYQAINSYQTSEGKIYCNHLRCPPLTCTPSCPHLLLPLLRGCAAVRVMYYMSEVVAGQGHGGLFVIPGSHKASFRWPEGQPTSLRDMTPETRSLFTEIPGKPGTALIFTHNLAHASLNESDRCRRVIHTAYNFGLFSRGWLGDHTDYEALHEKAPSGSWLVSFPPFGPRALASAQALGLDGL